MILIIGVCTVRRNVTFIEKRTLSFTPITQSSATERVMDLHMESRIGVVEYVGCMLLVIEFIDDVECMFSHLSACR
jgi:hypothetical protein